MTKKILMILGIIITIFITLCLAIILLLSVLFPNELVKKEIEKQASNFLESRLRIEKLKFSIFKGFLINNITLENKTKNYQNDNILKINEVLLSYRLLPLLFTRTLSVKALTLNNGEINLEKNKYGANWEHFLEKFNCKKEQQTSTTKVEQKNKENTSINKNNIPINFNIKKIGFENMNINYLDTTFLNKNLYLSINNFKLLGKNINIKENKSFDLDSSLKFNVNFADKISINSFLSATGKLKLFDEKGNLKINGPVKLTLQDGLFKSDEVRALISDVIKEYLRGEIGISLSNILKDPNTIAIELDKYFDDIMNNSKETINNTVIKIKEQLKKRTEIEKEANKILIEFDNDTNKIVLELDKKIEEIDTKINPLLNVAQNIPFIDRYVDIKNYRKRVKNLKDEIKNKKETLIESKKINLTNIIKNKIDETFPKKEVSYEKVVNDFNKQISIYKNEIKNKINKLSSNEIFHSIFKSIDILNTTLTIKKISTTYELGKEEQETKDVIIDLQFLYSIGTLKIKKNYINYLSDTTFLFSIFNLNFIPIENATLKIEITKENDLFKYKILNKPTLTLQPDKLKEIGVNIINNFLKSNYSFSKILKSTLGEVPINEINLEELKNYLLEEKAKTLQIIKTENVTLITFIDKEIEKIISDLKKKVPGI